MKDLRELREKIAAITCEGCALHHPLKEDKDDPGVFYHYRAYQVSGPRGLVYKCTSKADEILALLAESNGSAPGELMRCDSCGQDVSGREYEGHRYIFCHKEACLEAAHASTRLVRVAASPETSAPVQAEQPAELREMTERMTTRRHEAKRWFWEINSVNSLDSLRSWATHTMAELELAASRLTKGERK